MSSVVVVVFTVLAAVSVVLTRVRLRRAEVAGRARTSHAVLNLHTGSGLVALVLWVVLLVLGRTAADVFSDDVSALVGIAALAAWWVTSVAGLLILGRWLPTRGKRSAPSAADGWSTGPGLSLLAHVGMLVCVGVLTWAYAVGVV